MADKSLIEWTDATWNPIVGCSVVSPGCTNCYAMGQAPRTDALSIGTPWAGHPGKLTKSSKTGPVWTGAIRLVERRLTDPLHWKRPRKIFVNSMGDLFHESIPDKWIDRVFAVMALCPQHTFQVLTKRAGRMRDYLRDGRQNIVAWQPVLDIMNAWCPGWKAEDITGRHRARAIAAGTTWPLPNVWLGVSAEDQQRADERIPDLLATPAAVRFVSCEPLLGPIDLTYWLYDLHTDNGEALNWVIVGGESGKSARRMDARWARDFRDQCAAAKVPFFFKQWGQHDPETFDAVGKKTAGRLLDGVEHSEFPEVRT